MEADKLITEELIRGLDHHKRFQVLLFVIEGRIWLDRSLMITLRV
jgi:hypothetical protein